MGWLKDLQEPSFGKWKSNYTSAWEVLCEGDRIPWPKREGLPGPYQESELLGSWVHLVDGHFHQGVLDAATYWWHHWEGVKLRVHDGNLSASGELPNRDWAEVRDWCQAHRRLPSIRVIGLREGRLPRAGEFLWCRDWRSRVEIEIVPWYDHWVMNLNGALLGNQCCPIWNPREAGARLGEWVARKWEAVGGITLARGGGLHPVRHAWNCRLNLKLGLEVASHLSAWGAWAGV